MGLGRAPDTGHDGIERLMARVVGDCTKFELRERLGLPCRGLHLGKDREARYDHQYTRCCC